MTPADKPDLPEPDIVGFATDDMYLACTVRRLLAEERRKARAELIAELKPVAWIDDGATAKPSDHSPYRVVTDETKRAMPASVAAAYSQPLAIIPKE
jgi:hypothetical protein